MADGKFNQSVAETLENTSKIVLSGFEGRLVAVLRPSIDESIIEDHFITMIALLEPELASVLGLVLNCLWSSRSMDIPA